MSATSDIKLVVFDLGRVLIRICEDWEHASELAELRGRIPVLDPISRAVLHELSILCEIGAISHDIFCARVGHLFNVDSADICKISEAYLIGPFEGAETLLKDLKSRGLKVACLSNTNSHHWSRMNAKGTPMAEVLLQADYLFASHELKMRKPEDEIFEHISKLTGFTSGEILFFDDTLDNTVAAETAGWEAIVVNDRSDPISEIRAYLTDSRLL